MRLKALGLHSISWWRYNLSVLEISKCPKLREIPDGLQTLNSLKKLIIHECPDLKWIGCTSTGGSFTSLAELRITECHRLVDFPFEMLESSSVLVLREVVLKGLSRLSNLSRVIECLAKSVAGLTELRINVGVLKFMTTIDHERWKKIDVSVPTIKTVDRILQGCSCDSLFRLSLTGTESWECLPKSIQRLTSLYELELKNFGIEELPEWFDQYISSLTTYSCFRLKLSECKRLRSLPSTQAMRRLIEEKRVDITGCPELTTK